MCVCTKCFDQAHPRFDLASTKYGRNKKFSKNSHIVQQKISEKKFWIRGPMTLAIYESTGQDKYENQITANIQNSMSILKKLN